MLYFVAPLTSVIIRASAVEPHSGGVTNFMTDPSLETWIGLAAFIEAFILSTLGFNEDKDKRDYFLNIKIIVGRRQLHVCHFIITFR